VIEWFRVLSLGILEGVTEFIPISSTGHLILAEQLFKSTLETSKTFDIAIQLGAILAVVGMYRHTFYQMLDFKNWRDTQKLIIAALPIMAVGFLVHKWIKKWLFNPIGVGIALILGAILMIIVEKVAAKKTPISTSIKEVTPKQAFWIGLCQCAALWPGMSRSASTIMGGLLSGLDHKTAAEFSFLVAVPVMAIATAYELMKSASILSPTALVEIGVGGMTACMIAVISISTFLKLLQRFKLTPFAGYRLILGAIVLAIYFN
jgi:undecaprenyl-diphosphatase